MHTAISAGFTHIGVYKKAFVGVYVGNIGKVDPGGELLAGLDLGKGCIRLKKRDELNSTRLEAFLERLVDLRRSGAELGC